MIIEESQAYEILTESYNSIDAAKYIENNTIKFVHQIANKPNVLTSDIEICAMFTAMVSWSNMDEAVTAAQKLMNICEWTPTQYILGEWYLDIPDKEHYHMTLKGRNLKEVCSALRQFYREYTSVRDYIQASNIDTYNLLMELADTFSAARLGSPVRNSACKRLNLLLRWMVRKDNIDLGIWNTGNVSPSQLFAILDSNIQKKAKDFWLLSFWRDTWNGVTELTYHYQLFDKEDPLKCDLALNQYII